MFKKLLSEILAVAMAFGCIGSVALADELATTDPVAQATAEVAPTDAPQDDTQSDNTTELPDYDEHYSPHVSDISLAAGESVTVDVIDMAHEGARLPESAKLQSVEIVNQDLSDAVTVEYAADTGKLTVTTTAEFDADTECVLQFYSAGADGGADPSHQYDPANFTITCDAATAAPTPAADAVKFDRIGWIENYGTRMTLPNGTSNCVVVFYATNENGDITPPSSHSMSFVYESTYYFNARLDNYYIYHDDGSCDVAVGLYIDTIADTGGRYFHITLTAFPNYSDVHESRGLDIAVTNTGTTVDSIRDVHIKPGDSVTIPLDGILSNTVTWANSYTSSQPELLADKLNFDYDAQSRTLTITASPDFAETIDVTLKFFNNRTGELDIEYGFDVICDDSEALPTEQPTPTEPTPTEPAPTEPTPTEPTPTEPAPTEPASVRKGVVVNVNTSLNIRPSADTSGRPLTTVKNGTELTILGEQGNFYHVKLADGTTGYASKDYVRETTVEPEPTPTEPAPTEPASARKGVVVNVNTSLNIRPSADTSGRPLTTVRNGTKLTILGQQGDFYHVQLADGTVGYAAIAYVNELAIIDPDKYGYFVDVTTNGSRLNLRKTPGGTRIALIPNGTRLVIVDVVGEWSLVEYDGLRGYVSNQYIKNVLF